MTPSARLQRITFFGLEAVAFVFLGALLVLWPLLMTGGRPFMLADTAVYADQGKLIWNVLAGLLFETGPAAASANGEIAVAAGAQEQSLVGTLNSQTEGDDTVCSITYAAFIGLLLPFGSFWVLYAQAILVMAALYGRLCNVRPTYFEERRVGLFETVHWLGVAFIRFQALARAYPALEAAGFFVLPGSDFDGDLRLFHAVECTVEALVVSVPTAPTAGFHSVEYQACAANVRCCRRPSSHR